MKDCTTCKYGYEDERLGIPMCHHPKRFSEDCVNFNMHEEKEIKESEKLVSADIEKAKHAFSEERFPDEKMASLRRAARIGFEAGAKWDREQMMSKAVDADVKLTLHDKTGDISLHTGFLPKELGIKYGDKVRIIIVKENSHE